MGDLDRRKFLTCYVFTLLSCVISWKVALHLIVIYYKHRIYGSDRGNEKSYFIKMFG